MSSQSVSPDRQDRRKGRTRAALISAAQQLIRDGRAPSSSIKNVTDLADVGLGSFYNHFESKEELFDAAVSAAMDAYLDWLDQHLPEGGDPVTRLFESVRLTGRLATELPAIAAVLGRRFALLEPTSDALGLRMKTDVLAAVKAGNPGLDSQQIVTLLTAATGAMQAVLSSVQSLTAEETVNAADVLARAVLRMLSLELPAR
ncbi:TetR/AcrR family transcriptional regulator [Cryobacterium sp. AP23]